MEAKESGEATMSRLELKKPSLCSSGPLNTEILSKSLSVLSEIMISSYGPSGRLKHVHNGRGGYVLTTSQSSALLKSISATHPVLKVLIAAVTNHTSNFSDCGLFAAIMCCALVRHFQRINLALRSVVNITRHLLNSCIDYLSSKECVCKLTVEFDSSKALMCLARTALTSKPACMLTINEAEYVSTLIVRAFLLTVPNEPGNNVLGKGVIVPVEGQRVMESAVLPGLLIEMPGFKLHRLFSENICSANCIKTALFSISLSGDLCSNGEATLFVQSDVSPEAAVLEQLLCLAKQMINDQVDLVLCQKVIHPSLKQYLHENHVMAVERLGAAQMEPLTQMTGAQPIASPTRVSPTCYGHLKSVRVESFASKQFLHLVSDDTTICSILLCNRNGTALDELKRACYTAQHILQLTIKQPLALLGGGCTETHLASYLRYKSARVLDSVLKDLNCSHPDYQIVAEVFSQSLESVARSLEHDGGELLTDTRRGHLWSSPPGAPLDSYDPASLAQCGCGLYKKHQCLALTALGSRGCPFDPQDSSQEFQMNPKDQLVLDCFAAKVSSLQVAVETAALILDLAYVIEDQN